MKLIGLSQRTCPICGRKFYIRSDEHAWRDNKNRPVCSYECDRKSHGMTGKKLWYVEGKK